VVFYYSHKQWRQEYGFEGPNLEAKKRAAAIEKGAKIEQDAITVGLLYNLILTLKHVL
jgi:hypothetical protein